METTIKISSEVKSHLDKIKMSERETYNDVICILLEDYMELNEKTKKELKEREMNPKFVSHSEVLKKYKL